MQVLFSFLIAIAAYLSFISAAIIVLYGMDVFIYMVKLLRDQFRR